MIEKNIGTLAHIYDFLNGGYYASHNQLQYYNKEAYDLYLSNDREQLLNLYNQIKINIPNNIVSAFERSPGIRYFYCDCCHDAKIKNVYIDNEYLFIKLETVGMLGCLNIDNECTIKLKTNSINICQNLIDDFNIFKKMYWIDNIISFNAGGINFDLELQSFTDNTHENIKYNFIIDDIIVE